MINQVIITETGKRWGKIWELLPIKAVFEKGLDCVGKWLILLMGPSQGKGQRDTAPPSIVLDKKIFEKFVLMV